MRNIPATEWIDITALLAVLLIFFSIDVRSREPATIDSWQSRVFEWTSRLGGITTAFALAIGWISFFAAEETLTVHTAVIAVPGSIGVGCAIILGIEMLWQRPR